MILKILLLAFSLGRSFGKKNVFLFSDGTYSFRIPVLVGGFAVSKISETGIMAMKAGEERGWMSQEKFFWEVGALRIDFDIDLKQVPLPKFIPLKDSPIDLDLIGVEAAFYGFFERNSRKPALAR